jgi:hypothetical protein
MAFTLEDGTGLEDANAYISVAFADSYFADRGITEWTGTDTVKEQAIIRATDYIETRWGQSFLGEPEFPDTPQALSFPRLDIGIPMALRRATAEYALRALATSLMPDPTVNPIGVVSGTREKVGPLETEVSYSGLLTNPTLRAYPAADRLLAPLLIGRGRGRVYR